MAKFADRMDALSEGVSKGFQKIQNSVVTGYKKIENAFVSTFMAKEGESLEEARARVTAAQKERVGQSAAVSRGAGIED